jgi:L-iditol 2-dehydrogenase
MITIDSNIIHYKELFLTGAHGAMPIHHSKALKLIASGLIDAKKIISHTFTLDDIKEGFKITESKQGMRVVIKP